MYIYIYIYICIPLRADGQIGSPGGRGSEPGCREERSEVQARGGGGGCFPQILPGSIYVHTRCDARGLASALKLGGRRHPPKGVRACSGQQEQGGLVGRGSRGRSEALEACAPATRSVSHPEGSAVNKLIPFSTVRQGRTPLVLRAPCSDKFNR